jgi:hypothetical protein
MFQHETKQAAKPAVQLLTDVMKLKLIVISVTLFVIACFGLVAWHENDQFKPNVFPSTYPKWLFDSGYRIDFDAHQSLAMSNWITSQQTGWKLGSQDNFNPYRTQFLCDNYVIQIDTNVIAFQY